MPINRPFIAMCLLFSFSINHVALAEETLEMPHVSGVYEDFLWSLLADEAGISQAEDNEIAFIKDFGTSDAKFTRLLINRLQVPDYPGTFVNIEDGNGQVIQNFNSGTDISEPFFTKPVYGPEAFIVVYGSNARQVLIESELRSSRVGGFDAESVFLPNQITPLEAFKTDNEALKKLVQGIQSSIANISYVKVDDLERKFDQTCTGFLITKFKVLTNHHCISDEVTCSTASIGFGYHVNEDGSFNKVDQYKCASLLSNKSLDFSVIQLDRPVDDDWPVVEVADLVPTAGEKLILLHHPGGRAKSITFEDCSVFKIPAPGVDSMSDFAHTCDSETGSSGAPLFNFEGRVVGLHHWGRARLGEFKSANRAILMEKIITAGALE